MPQELLNRLKLIGVFCHVVESGSMREAAKKLGVSPPAVSQFINQLENELGVSLLYRSTRRINVSEAGEKYYQQGKKMLLAAEQAQETIHQSTASISGELRIALPVGLAARPVAQALAPIFEEHQNLRLAIIASDTEIDFIQQRVDVMVDCGKPTDSSYIYHYLGQNGVVLCASPSYVKSMGNPVAPDELSRHTWLGMNETEAKGILRTIELRHPKHKSVTIKPKCRFHFNDMNCLISHVQQGYGVAFLPELEVTELIKNGDLVNLLPDWQTDQHDIFALTLDKNYPSKVKLAIEALREFFDKG